MSFFKCKITASIFKNVLTGDDLGIKPCLSVVYKGKLSGRCIAGELITCVMRFDWQP